MTVPIKSKTYTGKAITQSPKVVLNGRTLKVNTDYTLGYKNNVKIGTATVTITGKNGYKGSVSKTFKINKISIAKAIVTGVSNKTYTGKTITQKPTVTLNNKKLPESAYSVSFSNNVKIGKATIVIRGKGNYTGTIKKAFRIGYLISKATITGIKNKEFNKTVQTKGATQSPVLKIGKTKLKNSTDYTLSYKNNKEVGTATVVISGNGKYIGSISKTFTIYLAKPTISLKSENHGQITCTAGIVYGATGYKTKYKNISTNENGTTSISGAGEHVITVDGLKASAQYEVQVQAYRTVNGKKIWSALSEKKIQKVYTGKSIKDCSIFFDNVKYVAGKEKEYSYTGSEIEPFVTVKKGLTTLKKDTDFLVTFSNNKKEGFAVANIKGIGKYYDSISGKFKIVYYPFIKENKTWYYRGGLFLPKTSSYDLDGALIVEEPMTVPPSTEIKCKKLTSKMNITLSTKAKMTVKEDADIQLSFDMLKDSSLTCEGEVNLKNSLSLLDTSVLTVNGDLNVSNNGSLLMKNKAVIDIGQDYNFNSGTNADNTALNAGTIKVSGNVTIKTDKYNADSGNTLYIRGAEKHKITATNKSLIGLLDLSDCNLMKLTIEGDGRAAAYRFSKSKTSKTSALDDLCKITFTPDNLDESEKALIRGIVFEQLFLYSESKTDLLGRFYDSAEGLAVFSNDAFYIPIVIPETGKKASLEGKTLGLNDIKYANLIYKNGKTYDVTVYPDPYGKGTKENVDGFMKNLSSSAAEECGKLMYDVYVDEFLGILADGGFAFDTTSAGLELQKTKVLVEVGEHLKKMIKIKEVGEKRGLLEGK